MKKLGRREFLGTAVVTAGVSSGAVVFKKSRPATVTPLSESKPAEASFSLVRSLTPTSQVPLGKSGLKVSLVGLGTGSIGYRHRSNQTQLGQNGFTQLMRSAFDRGINFFDLADAYGSHPYFVEAMKGVPRDRYIIQTKSDSRDPEAAREDIDRFLRELRTDYIDSLIIHHVTIPDWTTQYRGVMDVFAEAKRKGKIRAHGVTCHDFGALQAAAASDWVQINQVRWNPGRAHMDEEIETVRALFRKMRARGQGMIGMKVVGQGDLLNGQRKFTPAECFRFQVESGVVDAFVVGVEATSHVDELLHNTQVALNEVGYQAVV
ncbi:MAG TPA: aldo/keto reductase [Pyrinomonadaceae bacterium]|nr:aldo/keto reductase [Pyrinomonadaceae bacterium]